MIITDLGILRQKSRQLSFESYKALKIFERLDEELSKAGSGVGLSAIQIGLPYQAAIIRLPKLMINLYNPGTREMGEHFNFAGEGCLSLPGKVGTTHRYNKVKVENGDGTIIQAEGEYAVVIQHELDHFDGILFIDRIVKDKK